MIDNPGPVLGFSAALITLEGDGDGDGALLVTEGDGDGVGFARAGDFDGVGFGVEGALGVVFATGTAGVLEEESAELLRTYFSAKRG